MSGIFPETVNGGVVIRDANGNALAPANVSQAYSPPAAFVSTCLLTALPTDCTARISAAQVNAIVSEMLHFAYALSPTGTWTCTSLANMATAFAQWAAANKIIDGQSIKGAGVAGDPWHVDYTLIPAAIGLGDIAGLSRSDFLSLNINQMLSTAQLARVRTSMQMGTAVNYNVGNSPNNVIALDGATGKLPAVDGSLLTGVNATGAVSYTAAQAAYTSPQKEFLRQNAQALSGAGGLRNLVGLKSSASTWTVTADALQLEDANGASVVIRNINAQVDFAAAFNVIGSSSDRSAGNAYYVYAWYNPTTNVFGLTASNRTSGIGPSFSPAGFTYKRRIGWICLDGSNQVYAITQKNMKSIYTGPRNFASGAAGWQFISLLGVIPDVAIAVNIIMGRNNSSTQVGDNIGNVMMAAYVNGGVTPEYIIGNITMRAGQVGCYYYSSNGSGTASVSDWEDSF